MKDNIRKTRNPSPELTIEVKQHLEFSDSAKVGANNPVELPNRKTTKKKSEVTSDDRRRLKDLEILLTNCLNMAQALQATGGAKIVELLRDARARAEKLHSRGREGSANSTELQ